MMTTMDIPSFFKVLVHDYKSTLRIPPVFVKTFGEILPERALLKIKSGEKWSVKIERIEEHYRFTDGWPKFVKDLELKMGDFLVFWLMLKENSIFKVAIYGASGCEKEFNSTTTSRCPMIKVKLEAVDESDLKRPTCGKKSESNKIGENRSHGAQVSFNSVEDRCFTKLLSKNHRYRLHVPMRFARKTGLISKTRVKLQYLNGWSTTVVLKLSTKSHVLDMCGGWPEFRKKNRLYIGKKCTFEYIPETQTIQVQLLKGKH